MLHSPGDQAWNDYWVPNCEIWHSAEPLVLAGQFGYWHKSGEGSGGKGGLLSRCHLFLDWWRKRSDMKMKGDRDLFTQKQRELDTGRKMEKLRLKGTWKKQRIKEWEREGRKTCRGGFKGLMTICTPHWSGRTTLATLTQPRKSYPYIWHFTSCISYLIQLYYLPAIDMHHQSWPTASSRDRCLHLYSHST